MMDTFVEFLNHGWLPYIGRAAELQRLLSFWRETPEANGLRGILVSGEAGIGKSRLIEEALMRVQDQGGLAVHTKLLPESATSLLPLIARGLNSSDTARRLLRTAPDETIDSLLGALRRLARLRPTLLVVEDMHLLNGESLSGLTQLLDGLADETISLVATARYLDDQVLGVLTRYLVGQIELCGFRAEDLAAIWSAIFSSSVDAALVGSLIEATAGNPLAIRSALRGALSSGAIARIGGADAYRLVWDPDRFTREVKREGKRLGSGLAAHLSEEEQTAAQHFAHLGEAFAREAAGGVHDQAGAMIDRLLFRGVLKEMTTSLVPLTGIEKYPPTFPESSFPLLTFTHTLLHRHFVERGEVDASAIARVIGEGLPLYSLLPMELVNGRIAELQLPWEAAKPAFARVRYLMIEQLNYVEWGFAKVLWNCASDFYRRYLEEMTPEERHEQTVALILVELSLLGKQGDEEGYLRLAGRLMEMTESPASLEQAKLRLAAIAKAFAGEIGMTGGREKVWMEIEEVVRHFPDAQFDTYYGMVLAGVAIGAVQENDHSMMRRIESRLEVIAGEENESDVAGYVRGWILPSFLPLFSSKEELDKRKEQLRELEAAVGRGFEVTVLAEQKINLLDAIGEVDELLDTIDRDSVKLRAYTSRWAYVDAQVRRVRALAGQGCDITILDESIERLISDPREDYRTTAQDLLGSYLPETGVLLGRREWGARLLERYPEGVELVRPSLRLLLSLGHDNPWLPDAIWIKDDPDVTPLLETLLAEAAGDDRAAEAASALLGRPVLRLSDLVVLYLVLDLLERSVQEEVAGSVEREIGEAVARALEWLAERRLAAYMIPLLERAEKYLSAKEIKNWRRRSASIQRERESQLKPTSSDGRIKLSMLGTIAVQHPGGQPQKITGGRARTVLGMMVANQLVDPPLSYREFCTIAAEDDDFDRARNIIYVRLHNLRELLGTDAIVTEADQSPRLNLQLVKVDLLELQSSLNEARDGMRRGLLLRAYLSLHNALELFHGEVPFPGLYDEFFEAARADLESTMRDLLLRLPAELLREGDGENAERLLRLGGEAMPDDEELVELLCQALTQSGKRVDAERVRRAARARAIAS